LAVQATSVFGRYDEERESRGNCHLDHTNAIHKERGPSQSLDGPPVLPTGSSVPHMQPGNLNEAMRVLQFQVPLAFRYSVVYQKVQSLTGSTVIAL